MGSEPGDDGVRERVESTNVGDESSRGGGRARGRREIEGLQGGRREGVEEGLEERETRRGDLEGDGQVTVVVGE